MSESQGDGRPLLLIDVDGPLNPYRARWARRYGYASHRMWPSVWSARYAEDSRALRRGLRVRLRAADGPRLLALPYTPVWATTWAHEANEMIAPAIGIDEPLPVIDWPRLFETDPQGLYWKTRYVVAWAAGRPFAWIDDMITDLDARYVAEAHGPHALLLRVDPRTGLREPHWERLREWAGTVA
ncbi:HAD domain-containing protein [Streptomyces sp. NPDC047046]|uniref:HAD domain-containing protein n=1 Tax=Streptomyces sp. NPDC047046 TaxID=3155378 RepID=UPI0033D65E2A